MKKLLTILLLLLLFHSCSFVDPLKYKGCVVIDIDSTTYFNVMLKLNDSLSTIYSQDYIWISVPKWEVDRLSIGDTIK